MRLRSILIAATTVLLQSATMAQSAEEAPMRTLFGGDRPIHHGGWGAPTTHFTRIADTDALLVGARGGWLINHRFTLGLAGHGLVTPIYNKGYDAFLVQAGENLNRSSTLHMGYGGLLIEPIIAYRSPVHVSLPIIIGAGGVGYTWSSTVPQDFEQGPLRDDAQAFFVVEPGIDLEVNVIPLLRIGIGASFRYTTDIDLPATAKDALHGLNAGICVKVGRF